MKHFIPEHEIIFDCYYSPLGRPKNGEVVPHQKRVRSAYFYLSNDKSTFDKIEIPAHIIRTLYSELEKVESETKDMQYDSLPW